jgi:hemin uptake protein HemP
MPNMSEKSNSPQTPPRVIAACEAPEGAFLESRDLLAGRSEVVIRHEGRLYRLRRTRLGKLILTA